VVIHPQGRPRRGGWRGYGDPEPQPPVGLNGIRGGICLLARPGVQPQLCSAVQNHTRSHHCLQTCTQLAVVLSLQVFQQFVHSSANLYYGTKRNALYSSTKLQSFNNLYTARQKWFFYNANTKQLADTPYKFEGNAPNRMLKCWNEGHQVLTLNCSFLTTTNNLLRWIGAVHFSIVQQALLGPQWSFQTDGTGNECAAHDQPYRQLYERLGNPGYHSVQEARSHL